MSHPHRRNNLLLALAPVGGACNSTSANGKRRGVGSEKREEGGAKDILHVLLFIFFEQT
jgi:hypothetical protein